MAQPRQTETHSDPRDAQPIAFTVDQVALTVPKGAVDAARDFYGRLLGLQEIPRAKELEQHGKPGVWFQLGSDVELHIIGEDVPVSDNASSMRHLCLRTRDLDAAVAGVKARGGRPEPEDHPVEIGRRVFLTDPGGNKVEILERRKFTGPRS
jgi:catechol 2,3-dioxygenase-like lactoylglutathione lyase family enzyme